MSSDRFGSGELSINLGAKAMTHPVVERIARAIARVEEEQDETYWETYVPHALAALQAIEPLLAEAFEEGQNALPGSLAGYEQHTDYARRIIHELTEQGAEA